MQEFVPIRKRKFDNGLSVEYDKAGVLRLSRPVAKGDIVAVGAEIRNLMSTFIAVADKRVKMGREDISVDLSSDEIATLNKVARDMSICQRLLNKSLNEAGISERDRELFR